MILDIIIPCFNEQNNLSSLLPDLQRIGLQNDINVLVVDACDSSDNSQSICTEYSVQYHRSVATQRSIQMNTGAKMLSGDVLLFLHADVRPPIKFYELISASIAAGYQSGCFAYEFDSDKVLLKINSFFTRFNSLFTGGGDQAQFLTRECFEELGGFSEGHVIMEDFDLYERIRSANMSHKTIQSRAIVSARKYEKNSWIKVNLVNLIALLKYKADQDPMMIKSFYNRWIAT